MNTFVILTITDKDTDASTTRRFNADGMSEKELETKIDELVAETGYRKCILTAELCEAPEELVNALENCDVDVMNL